jgi:hypothetical protein
MSDEKKKISVLVPVSLLEKLKETSDLNITEATIKGLEFVADNIKSDDNIIGEYQREINLLKIANERLQEKIKIIDENQEKIKALNENNQELHQERIKDLKESVISLNDQIKIKDKIIEDLNKNVFAQANTLYNLTNTKLLQTEYKKPWWQFWKN